VDAFPLYRDYAALQAAQSLLNWDQPLWMPSGGASARAAHLKLLKRKAHVLLTSDAMRREIEEAEARYGPDSPEGAAAEALRRDLEAQSKLPVELVVRKASVSAEAYSVWRIAKPANDYAMLEPYYRELFAIARETADAIGFADHPYDALIGLYEYGATFADAEAMFTAIEPVTRELLNGVGSIDDSPLQQGFPPEVLRTFAQEVTRQIGFDYHRGRLDLCNNAFCTHFATGDVRMTTRPSEHFKGVVSSSLHEMGHGLYEQSIDPVLDGTPLQGGVSLAVHESQSRLWENVIGRSHGFWRGFTPLLHDMVPTLAEVNAEAMYRMVNRVQPEPIRVGADELSYNLHIQLRFELEVELIAGAIATKDLPLAWNAKAERLLGLKPKSDTEGCLQDVHWSKGSVGYFPTYSMGNVIGLQIWNALVSELGDPSEAFAQRDFGTVLGWLREKVYRHGRRFAPKDLLRQVTGEDFDPQPWIAYARTKYGR
jgi:carboxypeptidase Taq